MRYLPLTPDDRAKMRGVIGAANIDELFRDVPQTARVEGLFDLPLHAGELEVERELGELAALNRTAGAGPFFCGAGGYRRHVPAGVAHLVERTEDGKNVVLGTSVYIRLDPGGRRMFTQKTNTKQNKIDEQY